MLPNPYILLGFALTLALVGFGAYRHGVSTTANEYEVVIQKGAAESERVTREAVEAAVARERSEREAIEAANRAVADKLADVGRRLRGQLADANRKLAEVPADACLDAPVPADVRGLLRSGNPHGAGGGGQNPASAGAGGNDGGLSGGGGG